MKLKLLYPNAKLYYSTYMVPLGVVLCTKFLVASYMS